jgi:enoyl-CoA hydratase
LQRAELHSKSIELTLRHSAYHSLLFHPFTFQLNALNSELFTELNDAMALSDDSSEISAIVLTGSEKAFAAGADIKEMKDKQFSEVYQKKFLGNWTKMNEVKKPIIGAVSGFAVSSDTSFGLVYP